MKLPLRQIVQANALDYLRLLPEASVHSVVTSPPYWQKRDYGGPDQVFPAVRFTPMVGVKPIRVPQWRGQLGLEPEPMLFVGHLVAVFREVARVLRLDGTLWLNIGDSAASGGRGGGGTYGGIRRAWTVRRATGWRSTPGLQPKDLVGIPWRVALALQADGWILRAENIWDKRNCLPESIADRPHVGHEQIFLFSRQRHYFYDGHAVRQPVTGRAHSRGHGVNPKASNGGGLTRGRQNADWSAAVAHTTTMRQLRTVWSMAVGRYSGAHYATFPTELPRQCILAGTSAAGACPHCGAQWRPIVHRVTLLDGKEWQDRPKMRSAGKFTTKTANGVGHHRITVDEQLTGWHRECDCEPAPPQPCVILDPFAGSGTTIIEALRLGRTGFGIDLAGGDVDLGGHTPHERIKAAHVGHSLEAHQAGQLSLFHDTASTAPAPAEPAAEVPEEEWREIEPGSVAWHEGG